MIRYRLRLVRPDEGTQVPVALMTSLLGTLLEGNVRALRLRIEGRSTRRDAGPHWLREAASFSVVGVSSGSVMLELEAEPLRRMLPFFAIGLLGSEVADRPCVVLFVESLEAALSGREDPAVHDGDLLATFESLSGVFALGVERIEFLLDPASQVVSGALRAEDIERIARLRRTLAESLEEDFVATGALVAVDLARRSFTLRADVGAPLKGFVDDLVVSQIATLLGQRVTITGRAVLGAGGVVRHLFAESVQPAVEPGAPAGAGSGQNARLRDIEIAGLKSIGASSRIDLGALNVLIGANGAGKSNFVSFFKLLSALASPGDALTTHVARSGGASSLLHDGPAVTPEMTGALSFEEASGALEYTFRLVHGAPDTLLFAEERYRFTPDSATQEEVPWVSLGAGHRESSLHRLPDPAARRLLSLLRGLVVYQFHDTSDTARIRQRAAVADGAILRSDAGNLAPFLLRLREHRHDGYTRIVETIRQVAPFFEDFFLEPLQGTVMLQWRERNTEVIFQPHQSSDGMLRIMALVALLLQPYDSLPALLIVDEPELGLHPLAIDIVAGLFRSASRHAQIAIATQSIAFLDRFSPEEVIVVDRPDRESRFTRPDAAALRDWLEDYSLGELWEKNVIGGRPR